MFQFGRFATVSIPLHGIGLPHSDTGGSGVVCTSPPIFAAYRVLRRLREPRHPPCALVSLPFLRPRLAARAFLFQAPSFLRSLSLSLRPLSWLDFSLFSLFAKTFLLSRFLSLPALSMNFLYLTANYALRLNIINRDELFAERVPAERWRNDAFYRSACAARRSNVWRISDSNR